jgi:hypothetical protein
MFVYCILVDACVFIRAHACVHMFAAHVCLSTNVLMRVHCSVRFCVRFSMCLYMHLYVCVCVYLFVRELVRVHVLVSFRCVYSIVRMHTIFLHDLQYATVMSILYMQPINGT